MNIIFQWLVVFFAMSITDICWAFYIANVQSKHPLMAAVWCLFLFLGGAVGVVGYIKNRWLLIPASLGVMCGTYVAVMYC